MKILIPIIGFGAAGGYRVLSELATCWTKAGHHVDFLTDARAAVPYFPTQANVLRFDKRGLVRLPRASTSFDAAGNGVSIYTGMWRALRTLRDEHDVILANHSLTTWPIALMGRTRARKFYYVQAYEPEYYAERGGLKSHVLEAMSRWSYTLDFRQIANSPIYVNYEKIRATAWIPPGIDPKVFSRRSEYPDLSSHGHITLGVIGRREPAKGLRYVLEAFELLASEDVRIHLHIAYGNLPDGWTHERARVTVPRNDEELAAFYRSVDILIAPGTVQLGACHYPVLEAMACGTPVITTGYMPATRENAFLVPVKDGPAIADTVRTILNLPASLLRDQMDRAFGATKSFHWDHVADIFLKILMA